MISMRRLHDVTDELEASTPWEDLPDGGRIKRVAPKPEQAGDFYWNLQNGRRAIVIAMPTTAAGGEFTYVEWPIRPYPGDRPQWHWDGHVNAPTLTPSLHWVGVWHGWCEHGRLRAVGE